MLDPDLLVRRVFSCLVSFSSWVQLKPPKAESGAKAPSELVLRRDMGVGQ